MEAICVKKSVFQALKLIVISGAFVLLGIFLIQSKTKNPFVGWLDLIFFGIALLLGFYQLFDRREQLIANEQTLFDRMNLNEPIAWSSVEKITYQKTGFIFSKQEFAIVQLKHFPGENFDAKVKKKIRRRAKNMKLKFAIALTPLEGKAADLYSKLAELRANASIA